MDYAALAEAMNVANQEDDGLSSTVAPATKVPPRQVDLSEEQWDLLLRVMNDYVENVYSWHEDPMGEISKVRSIAEKLGFKQGLSVR